MSVEQKKVQFAESFDGALLSHIDWCIEDQENEYGNDVSAKDFTPIYDKLHDTIYDVLDEMSDDEIMSLKPYDETWDKLHDDIDFHDFLEYGDNVIIGDILKEQPKQIVIEDVSVINIWGSTNDPSLEVGITPDWYQDNGTPIDDEGDDMVYLRTEIRPIDNEEFATTLKLLNKIHNGLPITKNDIM